MISPDYGYLLGGGYKVNGGSIEISPRWTEQATSILKIHEGIGTLLHLPFNPLYVANDAPICYLTPEGEFKIVLKNEDDLGFEIYETLATSKDLSPDIQGRPSLEIKYGHIAPPTSILFFPSILQARLTLYTPKEELLTKYKLLVSGPRSGNYEAIQTVADFEITGILSVPTE